MKGQLKSIKTENRHVRDEKLSLEKEVASLEEQITNFTEKLEDADQTLKEMKKFESHFRGELLELRKLKKRYEEELGRLILGDFAYQFKVVLGRIIRTPINTVYDVKDFLKDHRSNPKLVETLIKFGFGEDGAIKELDDSIKAIMTQRNEVAHPAIYIKDQKKVTWKELKALAIQLAVKSHFETISKYWLMIIQIPQSLNEREWAPKP